jgi:hypothetical protein
MPVAVVEVFRTLIDSMHGNPATLRSPLSVIAVLSVSVR